MIGPYSVQVAAWKDDDGDWYETGLHIFCKSFVFYDSMIIWSPEQEIKVLVDRDPIKTLLRNLTLGCVYIEGLKVPVCLSGHLVC